MNLQTRAAALAARLGLTGLAIAVLLGLLAVQTARLEGFEVWPLKWTGWKARAENAELALEQVARAAALAKAQARAQRFAAEKAYAQASERIDDNAELQLESSLSAAERFIAANRVRCEADRSGSGGAGTAAGNHRTGNTEAAGSPAELDEGGRDRGAELVAVPAEDVRICTENTIKAEAAREWALEVERLSRAPAPKHHSDPS